MPRLFKRKPPPHPWVDQCRGNVAALLNQLEGSREQRLGALLLVCNPALRNRGSLALTIDDAMMNYDLTGNSDVVRQLAGYFDQPTFGLPPSSITPGRQQQINTELALLIRKMIIDEAIRIYEGSDPLVADRPDTAQMLNEIARVRSGLETFSYIQSCHAFVADNFTWSKIRFNGLLLMAGGLALGIGAGASFLFPPLMLGAIVVGALLSLYALTNIVLDIAAKPVLQAVANRYQACFNRRMLQVLDIDQDTPTSFQGLLQHTLYHTAAPRVPDYHPNCVSLHDSGTWGSNQEELAEDFPYGRDRSASIV